MCKNVKIQEYVFPWTCALRLSNFMHFQSEKPIILVCLITISDQEQPHMC